MCLSDTSMHTFFSQNVYVLATKASTTAKAHSACQAAALHGPAIDTVVTWVVIATSLGRTGASSRVTRVFARTSPAIRPTHFGLRNCTGWNCATALILVVGTRRTMVYVRKIVQNEAVA